MYSRVSTGSATGRVSPGHGCTNFCVSRANYFESEKWSVVKVANAMNNLLRRANKVARAEARRAEAQATAA